MRVQERRFAADLPERRRRSDLGRPFRDNVPNNSRIHVSAAGRQTGENNNHHSHLAGFHKIRGFWALKKTAKNKLSKLTCSLILTQKHAPTQSQKPRVLAISVGVGFILPHQPITTVVLMKLPKCFINDGKFCHKLAFGR